jgi:exodeoxyribonuclease V gamma subunit
VEEMVEPVRALYMACTNGRPLETESFELRIGGGLLRGTLRNVLDGRLVQVCWSKNETKYLLEAYIRYLAGTAAGTVSGLSFVSGNRQRTYTASVLSRPEAVLRLTELIGIYKAGFERIMPFYPDFGVKPGDLEGLDPDRFSKLVEGKLGNPNYPCDDLYIMTEYDNGYFESGEVPPLFLSIAGRLLSPLAELFPDYYE